MPNHAPARRRPWHAALIITLFFIAVAGAAATGWWYARESPPHQGPIILVSVDGIAATALPSADRVGRSPAIDALSADSVVFERAYSHSPQLLPSHASILSGRLPVEHGVRDDAGFALKPEVRTLAQMLRNRGFATGAAVSSFLMRPDSGLAQGFVFFDAEIDESGSSDRAIARSGLATLDAAERWARAQEGQRYFLFVQVADQDADAAVTRLTQLLKDRELYDRATFVLVGDRGATGPGVTLDETTLRVPLLIKQPRRHGAGRRIPSPVQHIDLVPTVLDLVRAPIPGGLSGHSLRAVLDDEDDAVEAEPIYAESLAAYFRFGGQPLYAITHDGYRYLRGGGEQLVTIDPPGVATGGGGGIAADLHQAIVRDGDSLRAALDKILQEGSIDPPAPLSSADEDRLALAGYLPPLRSGTPAEAALDAREQEKIAEAHFEAALLAGQRRFSAAIRALQAIVRQQPTLAPVYYQIGGLLSRTGRVEEAIDAYRAAGDLRPDAVEARLALAEALVRNGRAPEAQEQVDAAVRLAEKRDSRTVAAAHEMAARVALVRKDAEAALKHAEAARAADESHPMPLFVRGRLLYDAARYEEALAAFQEAADVERESPLAELHMYLGETYSHLDRHAEAESEFREELRTFPHDIRAYTSLAMLYRAMNRDAAVEDVLHELVVAAPTPEGYAVAARLWTILGERSRAEALRSDARMRFRDDPSLAALLGRDARR